MSQVYHFQNFYVTRLREAVDESSTTIYVDNPPTISSGILVLEGKNASKREIVYFSSVGGYALNDCARGLEGTIPNTHNQGATVEQAVTAGQLDQVLSPHILLQGLGDDENAAMSQDAVTRVFTEAHNTDGTLKNNSVTTAAVANNAMTASKIDFTTFESGTTANGWAWRRTGGQFLCTTTVQAPAKVYPSSIPINMPTGLVSADIISKMASVTNIIGSINYDWTCNISSGVSVWAWNRSGSVTVNSNDYFRVTVWVISSKMPS